MRHTRGSFLGKISNLSRVLGLQSLNQVGDTVSMRSSNLLSRRSDASDVFSAAFYSLEGGVSILFGFDFDLPPRSLGIARCAVHPRSTSSYPSQFRPKRW